MLALLLFDLCLLCCLNESFFSCRGGGAERHDLCHRQGQGNLRVFVARFYLLFWGFVCFFDSNAIYGQGVVWHSTGGEETPEGPHCPAPPAPLHSFHSDFLTSTFLFLTGERSRYFFLGLSYFHLCWCFFSFLILRIVYFIWGRWGPGRLGGCRTNVAIDLSWRFIQQTLDM